MAGAELTSLRSPRVQAARRLAKRSFRAAERRFLAEGPQAVREALARDGTVVEVFATADARHRYADLLDGAATSGIAVHQVSGEVMAAIAQTVTPQGVVAVCRFIDVPLDAVLAAQPCLVTVLAHVRDPGNVGTVIRAADAAGADGIVISAASVDVYNGKSVRASAGSVFHVPVVTGIDVPEALARLQSAGLQVLAADAAGGTDLDSLADEGRLARPTAWVFGNEAWGLPGGTRALADGTVRVPIHGRAESLNLAAAAAVCLYASARAQRVPGGCRS
jgi:TrmH family RNA methyltransferase